MKTLDQKDIIGITALLVHAAKIDEQYSDHEKILIKEFIKSYSTDEDEDSVLKKVEEIESFEKMVTTFFIRVAKWIGISLIHFVRCLINIIVKILTNKIS